MLESDGLKVFLFLLFLLALLWGLRGIRSVRPGYRGVVYWMGRRTGDVRDEGFTWLPPFLAGVECVAVRERQVRIPSGTYFTADRARLDFETVVRVAVADPAKLLDQGPGTFKPFLSEHSGDDHAGDEEHNVALRRLMQNAVREGVSVLTSQDVLFGGRGTEKLRESIQQQLQRTAHRWGLDVREVWVVDVHGHAGKGSALDEAFGAGILEAMKGHGSLARQEAKVAEGALFAKIGAQLVQQMARIGESVSLQDAVAFLQGSYQSEQDLQVALARAENIQTLAHEWVVAMPSAVRPPPAGLGGGHGRPALGAGGGGWVVGRSGEIVIQGDGVSRQHALVEREGDRLLVTDLGSKNGTWVGDRRLPANVPTPVDRGATVRFGQSVRLTGEDLLSATRGGGLRSA